MFVNTIHEYENYVCSAYFLCWQLSAAIDMPFRNLHKHTDIEYNHIKYDHIANTLPTINISHKMGPFRKETVDFQPSFFQGGMLVFRGAPVVHPNRTLPKMVVLTSIHLQLKNFHQTGTAKFSHDPGGETPNFAWTWILPIHNMEAKSKSTLQLYLTSPNLGKRNETHHRLKVVSKCSDGSHVIVPVEG